MADTMTAASTGAVRRAEARKLAQVRKLTVTLGRLERAGYTERAEQVRGQIAARLVGRCRECHRVLTDPTSVAAGIGPECATKGA